MNPEVQQELEQGPRVLPWTIVIFLLALAAWLLRSLLLAGLAGLIAGYYQGFYCGSTKVLRAWRHDIRLDREKLEQELTPCTD